MTEKTPYLALVRPLVPGDNSQQDLEQRRPRDPAHMAGPHRDRWMHDRISARSGRRTKTRGRR